MGDERNEVGTAPGRGRPQIDRAEAEDALSQLADEAIQLPRGAVTYGGPTSCPACRSAQVMWAIDAVEYYGRRDVHPLIWHPEEWLADSFVCQTCTAGWIEPDEPAPITWVRPFWKAPKL